MHKAVYNSMKGNLQRRYAMQRLHLYSGVNVPDEIMSNVTNQLKQNRVVPKRLDHIDEETVRNFPQIMDYPKNYILKWDVHFVHKTFKNCKLDKTIRLVIK